MISTLTNRVIATTTLATAALTLPLAGCSTRYETPESSTSSGMTNSTSNGAPGSASHTREQSAEAVWAQAQKTAHDYTSLVATCTDALDGSGPKVTFTGDLDGEPAETRYAGPDIGQFTMRHLGTSIYLKGDATFWRTVESRTPPAKGAVAAANRWIRMPATAVPQEELQQLSVRKYVSRIGNPSDPKWASIGTGDTMSPTSIEGKSAYKIVSRDGDTTVWVSDDGRYDLIRIVDQAAATTEFGTATFSRWNEKIAIDTPSGALEGGSGSSPRSSESARVTT